ncbi:MAG TPA: class I SAM-dependent methyltransferase [Nitrospira sp.]|nr:class I SAM-dependent methyltransferase [Nitrospira sp.]
MAKGIKGLQGINLCSKGEKMWLHRLRVRTFNALQSVGIHAIPNHFYGPIPDTRLPEETWTGRSSLPGIRMNEPCQIELAQMLCGQFGEEFAAIPTGTQFGGVDGEVLHGMVRYFRPSRILEVGSGTSTRISAAAVVQNGCGEVVAVEPYPNDTLKAGFPGLSRLVVSPAQSVPMAEFESLGEGDILFIDSSHVLKIGSDVQFLFLEVLPRLKPGVIVHVHDIFLPQSYPRKWVVDELRFWNEQYLLQAFLAFNSAFEVLWAAHYMNLRHPEVMGLFPSYQSGVSFPASFWMQKKR